jgi:integrase
MGRSSKPRRHYGKWRIRWVDADGERQSEVYDKFEDAELVLERRRVEAKEIRRGLRPRPVIDHTFDQLADYWLDRRAPRKRSEKDDRSIINRHLLPAFTGLKLTELDIERIDDMRDGLEVSDKTEHNILTLLITMLTMAVDELKWLSDRPKIRKPAIVVNGRTFRYLKTQEEIERFLKAARSIDERTHALYATAIYSGARAGELAGLLRPAVNFETGFITIERSFDGPTKTGAIRNVPILDALRPVLSEWHAKNQLAHVFPNAVGNMLQPSARIFQEVLRDVLAKAKFPKLERDGAEIEYLTFHSLRHTFATHWMMRGGSLYKLQQIGGWASQAMISRYAHFSPDAYSREDYERFNARPVVEQ